MNETTHEIETGDRPEPDRTYSEPHRTCRWCNTSKPITEYRIQSREPDGRAYRSHQCRQCHNRVERERSRRKRKDQRDRRIHSKLALVARAKSQRRCVAALAESLLEGFGGVEGFAKSWTEAITEATACKRIRAGEALVVFLQWLEEHPEVTMDIRTASDEELERAYRDALAAAFIEFLRDHRGIATRLLAQSGFVEAEPSNVVE